MAAALGTSRAHVQNVLALELHHERSIHAEVRGDAAALAERARTDSAAAAAAVAAADAKRRAVEEELVLVKGVIAEAEAAAAAAAQQCTDLHGAVMHVAAVRPHASSQACTRKYGAHTACAEACGVRVQADAAARKRLAVRAFQLREGMVHCRADLRQQRGLARRQRTQLASAARVRRDLLCDAAGAEGARACEAEELRAHNVRSCCACSSGRKRVSTETAHSLTALAVASSTAVHRRTAPEVHRSRAVLCERKHVRAGSNKGSACRASLRRKWSSCAQSLQRHSGRRRGLQSARGARGWAGSGGSRARPDAMRARLLRKMRRRNARW